MDIATGDPKSPLYGAGNSGVIARDGRLVRRDDEARGETYAEGRLFLWVAKIQALMNAVLTNSGFAVERADR